MRERKLPPSRRSTELWVVCQSSDAAFHCMMSPGVFQARQTSAMGALARASMVIFTESSGSGDDARCREQCLYGRRCHKCRAFRRIGDHPGADWVTFCNAAAACHEV